MRPHRVARAEPSARAPPTRRTGHLLTAAPRDFFCRTAVCRSSWSGAAGKTSSTRRRKGQEHTYYAALYSKAVSRNGSPLKVIFQATIDTVLLLKYTNTLGSNCAISIMHACMLLLLLYDDIVDLSAAAAKQNNDTLFRI